MDELLEPARRPSADVEAALVLQQVVIRKMEAEDLPALEWEGEYTHFRAVYRKVYDRMVAGTAVMWAVESARREMIGQAFVQLQDNRNSKSLPEGRQAYIHSFRIRPAYRSLGLGKKLLTFIESDLIERGYDYAALNVSRTNLRAKRLYTRMGYRVVGRDAGAWSYHDHMGVLRYVNEPGWYMRKKIGD